MHDHVFLVLMAAMINCGFALLAVGHEGADSGPPPWVTLQSMGAVAVVRKSTWRARWLRPLARLSLQS